MECVRPLASLVLGLERVDWHCLATMESNVPGGQCSHKTCDSVRFSCLLLIVIPYGFAGLPLVHFGPHGSSCRIDLCRIYLTWARLNIIPDLGQTQHKGDAAKTMFRQ